MDDSATSEDTDETPPEPGIVASPPKKVTKVKADSVQFSTVQELHIAEWLSANDWLWRQGVSILFIILFIYLFVFIYLYVYNLYSALNVASLLCILPAPYY